jgi:hypothetical protein
LTISSGDPEAGKAIEACIFSNGGLYLSLADRGKDTAVLKMAWASYPGAKL